MNGRLNVKSHHRIVVSPYIWEGTGGSSNRSPAYIATKRTSQAFVPRTSKDRQSFQLLSVSSTSPLRTTAPLVKGS